MNANGNGHRNGRLDEAALTRLASEFFSALPDRPVVADGPAVADGLAAAGPAVAGGPGVAGGRR